MQTQIIFMGSVFIAGILSFFSPCILPLLPVYFAKLVGDVGGRIITIGKLQFSLLAIMNTLSFIFGISTVFILLGYGAGALSQVIYHPFTTYIMGACVIILGLHQMEILNIKTFQKQKSVDLHANRHSGLLSAYLLGVSFSFGWTPCIGPVLSSVLAIVASNGEGTLYGATLMFIYALGLAIPFVIMALTSSYLMRFLPAIKQRMFVIKKVGGGLIVLMGIVLILGQFNWLSTIFN